MSKNNDAMKQLLFKCNQVSGGMGHYNCIVFFPQASAENMFKLKATYQIKGNSKSRLAFASKLCLHFTLQICLLTTTYKFSKTITFQIQSSVLNVKLLNLMCFMTKGTGCFNLFFFEIKSIDIWLFPLPGGCDYKLQAQQIQLIQQSFIKSIAQIS